MFDTLILAEKPAAARTLAKLLLKGSSEPAELEIHGTLPDGRRAVISSFNGHVIEQFMPDDYDPKWAWPWRLEVLPFAPPNGQWKHKPSHPEFLRRVSRLWTQTAELVNACDAGREGELIFWEAMRFVGWSPEKVPTTRLWLTDPSARGAHEAYIERRKITEKRFVRMAAAADARSKADLLIGSNGTRYLTRTIPAYGKLGNPVYPVGRVKTPTLNIIERRIAEIERFVSSPFYSLTCEFFSEKGNYFASVLAPPEMRFGFDDLRFKKYDDTVNLRREIATSVNEWSVYDQIDPVLEYAPEPFDLTELQRVCFRMFGWSPKQTLQHAQALYIREQAISYPRTDSRRIPLGLKEEVLTCHEHLWNDYLITAYPKLESLAHAADDHFFKAEKAEHHAIVPTGVIPRRYDAAGHPLETWMLWDLIVRRFVAALYPPAQIDASSRILEFTNTDETQTARAMLKAAPVAFPGWLLVEDAVGNAGGQRKPLKERLKITWPPTASTARLVGVKISEGFTTPPEYHTEDTLLAEMEKLGLGTVATRGDIIAEIFADNFVERRENGHLFPTGLGSYHLGILHRAGATALTEPELTASWEKYFEKIEAGDKQVAETGLFLQAVLAEIAGVGRALQNLPRGPEMVICPKSFHIVGAYTDEKGACYRFDGYPKTRVPAVLCGRNMKVTEWREVFEFGRKGYGPFRFISPKSGNPFVARLRHVAKEHRFEFVFPRGKSDEPVIE